MKRIALLGSTGSIGKNTLEVARKFPGKFRITALSAHSNIELLSAQSREFKPEMVCVTNEAQFVSGNHGLKSQRKLFYGFSGMEAMLESKNIDMVVLAISGSCALFPLWKALEEKKEIATANKEALVMSGPLISRLAARNKVKIIPIDSEQSAIWQCLEGEDKRKLNKIYLTASGGPFRKKTRAQLKKISVRDALAHPRWKMGRKITVDSATLINKGLEVLEAMCLFGVAADKIEVVVHPESIIHSMVEFVDGVVMAQLSATDMRVPIQYAMSYPERLSNDIGRIDFAKLGSLTFEKPDFERFPCLRLAYEAAGAGGTMPCVLNAANEVCVNAFLNEDIKFISIPEIIEKTLKAHENIKEPELKDILAADSWAREKAAELAMKLKM